MGWQTLRVTEAATFSCKQLPQRSTHNVSHVGMTNGVPIWAVDEPAALIHTPATFHVPLLLLLHPLVIHDDSRPRCGHRRGRENAARLNWGERESGWCARWGGVE